MVHFTTIAANLAICGISVSRNAFFSSRSEKNIFFDSDIVVKNKSKLF